MLTIRSRIENIKNLKLKETKHEIICMGNKIYTFYERIKTFLNVSYIKIDTKHTLNYFCDVFLTI